MRLIKNFFQDKPNLLHNLWGLWMGLFALVLRLVTPPQYIEQWYSRFVFLGIRQFFDATLAYSPFALLLPFYVVALYFVLKILILLFIKKQSWWQRLTEGVLKLLNWAGVMLFLFFILWGFNYGRERFTEQIGLTIEKLDTTSLRQELLIAAQEAIAARDTLEKMGIADTNAITYIRPNFEQAIRKDVSQWLENHQFPAKGRLRGREIEPDGLLFRFGIAGIYMPYTGESSIDHALHPLEKPFSMAHEMAHGFGWTEEAIANFVAYLSCIESEDWHTRYSGRLSYFRYVASNFRRQFPEEYKKFREKLPIGIKNDMKAINDRINRYPDWFDTTALNDAYLKSQGVTEGVESYARIVVLVHSWRKKINFAPKLNNGKE
ncbi:MAG: DUF3810 domain-containing protein [Saprospiraceae bacterium]|nr:DUF3810 domain-containing protein [Saprospiraceae bacterium]